MTTEVSDARDEVERATDQPWYRAAARAGWVARGLLFIVTAVLALQLGLGQRREETNQHGAMEELAQKPFGKVLLLVLAVGLLAYAGWRLVEIVLNRSQDRGFTARAKHVAHAAAYLALSFMALGTLLSPNGQGGGGQQQGITARVLSWPGAPSSSARWAWPCSPPGWASPGTSCSACTERSSSSTRCPADSAG